MLPSFILQGEESVYYPVWNSIDMFKDGSFVTAFDYTNLDHSAKVTIVFISIIIWAPLQDSTLEMEISTHLQKYWGLTKLYLIPPSCL